MKIFIESLQKKHLLKITHLNCHINKEDKKPKTFKIADKVKDTKNCLVDIVIIIDCTGSMSEYFPEIRKTINVVRGWFGSESCKFGIVGYTDHEPDNGPFPAENPVSIFPPDMCLINSKADALSNYLEDLKIGGGGELMGEALIDGLAAVITFKFKEQSNKIFILICDDSPHGDEFQADTTYPEGCKCGRSWSRILLNMKLMHATFIFVKLTILLDQTVELFQKEYDQAIKVISVSNTMEFSNNVNGIVVEIIKSKMTVKD